MPRFQDRNIDPSSSYPLRQLNIPLVTIAVSQTKRAFWIHKFTRAVKLKYASVYASAVTAALTVLIYITDGNQPLNQATIVVDAAAEKYKNTAVSRYLTTAGLFKEIAANTAQVFSAAHTINLAAVGQKWGTIIIQQNAADGVLSTKVISADQAYASQVLAEAAAATVVADAGKFIVGAITIQSKNATAWTANTDDMTAASDVAAVTFYSTGVGVGFSGTVLTPSISVVPVGFTETIEDAFGPRVIRANQYAIAAYTSDGTGAATNAALKVEFLPYPIRGDSLLEV